MVHDRVPVIVQARDCQRWLDPENEDVADILATPPSERMIAYPVSGGSTARSTTTQS
jgi:putative SOS response-associated peptidase YedK